MISGHTRKDKKMRTKTVSETQVGNRYVHGGYSINRPEYNSWRAMRERCNNPKYKRYDRYGGRGIKVCERWDDGDTGFLHFLEDMGKKPDPKYTIDRIDNDGMYEPSNCQWISMADNSRKAVRVYKKKYHLVNGISDTVRGHCARYNIDVSYFYRRRRKGMTMEEALGA